MDKHKIQIAFYCSSVSWGGLEMNTLRYAVWMQETGWKVTLFCVADSPLYKKAFSENIVVHAVNRNRKYFDLINAWRIHSLFKKNNVRICWFRDNRDFDLLGLVSLFSGGKIKLLYQQAMQLGVDKKDVIHHLRFGRINAWVSTLGFLAEQVKQRTTVAHDKIYIVPLGVDDKILAQTSSTEQEASDYFKIPSDIFTAGIIGRIDPLKGQHVAIEALKHLHEHGHKIQLLIVGESTLNEGNDYEKSLHELVANSGLEDYVHFRPFTNEVSKFYSAIDVFWLCSKGETFGTVTIEAMSMSKAIIGTDSSGTPEILKGGEAGLLYPPMDASVLSKKTIYLINNPEIKKQLETKARMRFIENYSKEISLRRMEQIIEKII